MPRHHGSILFDPASWTLLPLELSWVIQPARQTDQLTGSDSLMSKHSAPHAATNKLVVGGASRPKQNPCHGERFGFPSCLLGAPDDCFLWKGKCVDVCKLAVGTSPDMIRPSLAPDIMQPQDWDNAGETGSPRSSVVFPNSQCWLAELHCLPSNLKNKHVYF